MHRLLPIVIAFMFGLSAKSHAAYVLSFNSSPQNWGSFTVVPESGYLFSVVGATAYFADIQIASLNSPFGPLWNPASGAEYHYWNLQVSAPEGQTLTVGHYEGAARWPFQAADQPGLTFSGDHRGNNQNAGFFDVLEIARSYTGEIERLAIDFMQYDEAIQTRWVAGHVRFNSAVPVPEPSQAWFVVGAAAIALSRRGKPQPRVAVTQ